jgi:hypothetical protein
MPLSDTYINWVKEQRKAKKLHTIVEKKLISILSKLAAEFEPIPEPQGLAGGRNDLILFRFDGKKVLFEIFGSKSQVSRDLRILDNTKADVKIAVLIDKEVDKGIIDKFLKENPENNYPYIFIGELFENDLLEYSKYKLKELIYRDEESKWQRITAKKIKLNTKEFQKTINELGIEIISKEDIEQGKITLKKVITTRILSRINSIGLKREKQINILSWLSDEKTIPFLMSQLDLGLNVFLYTDCQDEIGFYSDVDLVHYLRIGYEFSEPYLLISMNSLIYELIEKYITPPIYEVDRKNCIKHTIGFSEINGAKEDRVVCFGIPRNTKRIFITTPMPDTEDIDNEERINYYKSITEFTDRQVVFSMNPISPTFSEIFENLGS